jgi:hypothetical protein
MTEHRDAGWSPSLETIKRYSREPAVIGLIGLMAVVGACNSIFCDAKSDNSGVYSRIINLEDDFNQIQVELADVTSQLSPPGEVKQEVDMANNRIDLLIKRADRLENCLILGGLSAPNQLSEPNQLSSPNNIDSCQLGNHD